MELQKRRCEQDMGSDYDELQKAIHPNVSHLTYVKIFTMLF